MGPFSVSGDVRVRRIRWYARPRPGAVSSVGRAPARQAGGRWFEPSTAHSSPLRSWPFRPARKRAFGRSQTFADPPYGGFSQQRAGTTARGGVRMTEGLPNSFLYEHCDVPDGE